LRFDTKRLPLIKGENKFSSRECLFVAIDDFSCELYAAILLDKTQFSAANFLRQVIDERPYGFECAYSDNGTEYKGKYHAFVSFLCNHKIGQKFTKKNILKPMEKLERAIRTLIEMWHQKTEFTYKRTQKFRANSIHQFLQRRQIPQEN
jgi:hypothetical protein